MRKQLLAIFSMFGLAGSSAAASPQVVKSSDEANKATTESKIKKVNKTGSENAAGKNDAQLTMRKAGGEQQAQQDVVSEKIGPDKASHKHLAGVKYEKHAAEGDAAKNDAAIKRRKTGGEQSAAGSDQGKKHIKSNTAMGDGSVRTSTVGSATGGAGSGKVATQDVHKVNKNAAESQAAQQDLQKKVDKAKPK